VKTEEGKGTGLKQTPPASLITRGKKKICWR